VSVFDFGLVDGQPFLVLEWVDGTDLDGALSMMARPSVELALHLVAEVAYGLEHAHRARDLEGRPMAIVHRDVSPENVLVSFDGDVKLTDFGIAYARRRLESTRIGIAKGKLPYMAPEQLRSDDLDARTDIFALGCVLHRIVSGRTPFSDDRVKDLAEIDPTLPEDVRSIVWRATRPLKKDRYESAEAMAQDAARALARRAAEDPRGQLREWLRPFRRDGSTLKDAEVGPKKGDLVDLELVLGSGDEFQESGPQITPQSTMTGDPEVVKPAELPEDNDDLEGSTIG
jgi:serine/threonine-protein kinase